MATQEHKANAPTEFTTPCGNKIRVVDFGNQEEITITGANERTGWILVQLNAGTVVIDQVGGDETEEELERRAAPQWGPWGPEGRPLSPDEL